MASAIYYYSTVKDPMLASLCRQNPLGLSLSLEAVYLFTQYHLKNLIRYYCMDKMLWDENDKSY